MNNSAICVLSVITGNSYTDIEKDFNLLERILEVHINSYLARMGYEVYTQYTQMCGAFPFAKIHYCYVNNAHYVVMFQNGKVYDPINSSSHSLDDYAVVGYIAGVNKIGYE